MRRRRGVDLAPVDATGADGERLLRSFLWPGPAEREARLDAAIATLRRTQSPHELVGGDWPGPGRMVARLDFHGNWLDWIG